MRMHSWNVALGSPKCEAAADGFYGKGSPDGEGGKRRAQRNCATGSWPRKGNIKYVLATRDKTRPSRRT